MTPENPDIPDWARRERQADLGWIAENLDVFSAIASVAFENSGRGAIVVDTTSQAMPGAGHPFGYFSQEQIEELGDEDTSRMVTEYEPAQEFVVVLLKPKDRASTYRVGVVARGLQVSRTLPFGYGRAVREQGSQVPPGVGSLTLQGIRLVARGRAR
jgi:hypothetical protein